MLKRDDGLPTQVAHLLLQRIIANEFPPGSVLPSEREIGETYGVSRPVAREAIKLLAARSIIVVQPRQGAVVGLDLTGAASEALTLAFHQAHVVQEDLLDARRVLEPHIVALAATNGTPLQRRQLQEIRRIIASLQAALDEGNVEAARSLWSHDSQLHMLLAEMSQNPVFKILIEVIVGILWKQRDQAPAMTTEHLRQASLQHAAVIDAVLASDPEAARVAIMAHLEYTHHHIFDSQNRLQQRVQMVLE